MNVYEFSGANIFMSWKMKHSIQRGEAELDRMSNLSTNEKKIAPLNEWKTFIICII